MISHDSKGWTSPGQMFLYVPWSLVKESVQTFTRKLGPVTWWHCAICYDVSMCACYFHKQSIWSNIMPIYFLMRSQFRIESVQMLLFNLTSGTSKKKFGPGRLSITEMGDTDYSNCKALCDTKQYCPSTVGNTWFLMILTWYLAHIDIWQQQVESREKNNKNMRSRKDS